MLSAGAARIVCSGLADSRETGRYGLHRTLRLFSTYRKNQFASSRSKI